VDAGQVRSLVVQKIIKSRPYSISHRS